MFYRTWYGWWLWIEVIRALVCGLNIWKSWCWELRILLCPMIFYMHRTLYKRNQIQLKQNYVCVLFHLSFTSRMVLLKSVHIFTFDAFAVACSYSLMFSSYLPNTREFSPFTACSFGFIKNIIYCTGANVFVHGLLFCWISSGLGWDIVRN